MSVIDPNKIRHIGSDPRKKSRPIEWWSDRIDNFHKEGSQFAGCCPCHEDDDMSSLKMKPVDGPEMTWVNCQAGCEYTDILSRANGAPPSAKNPTVAITTVPNSEGGVSTISPDKWWEEKTRVPWSEVWEPLGCTVDSIGVGFHFVRDGFTKIRKTGTKEFKWMPSGETPPSLWPSLPRELPEVVYLTEGESDTGSAWALGFHAHGLTKGTNTPITSQLIRTMRDKGAREIRLLFDADGPGRDAASKFEELSIAVSGIKIVPIDLSPILNSETNQKDLNDLLHSIPKGSWSTLKDQIELLASKTATRQPFTISGPEYFEKYSQTPGILVPEWIDAGAVGFIAGREGSYKSWLALGLALTVANNRSFLGLPRPAKTGKVLFFPMEDSHYMTQSRIGLIAGFSAKWEDGGHSAKILYEYEADKSQREVIARKTGQAQVEKTRLARRMKLSLPRENLNDLTSNLIIHDSREFSFENDVWLERLEEEIAHHKPALVVIDPLFAATGIESLRDFMAAVAQRVARDLKRMRDRHGCTFLIVHHLTNTSGEMWGSAFLKAAREFRIDTEAIEGGVRVSRYSKALGKMPALDVMFSQHSGPLEVTIGPADFSDSKSELKVLHIRILTALRDTETEEGSTIRELKGLIDDDSLGKYDLSNAINQLRENKPPLVVMMNKPESGKAGLYGITDEGITKIGKNPPQP